MSITRIASRMSRASNTEELAPGTHTPHHTNTAQNYFVIFQIHLLTNKLPPDLFTNIKCKGSHHNVSTRTPLTTLRLMILRLAVIVSASFPGACRYYFSSFTMGFPLLNYYPIIFQCCTSTCARIILCIFWSTVFHLGRHSCIKRIRVYKITSG